MRILCADDNEWTGMLFERVLTKAHHEVQLAPDGLSAWNLLADDLDHFDLVILDQEMPGLKGLEIARRLRQLGFNRTIVVQSGFLTPQLELSLEGLRVDRVLPKPIWIPTIMSLISDFA